MACLWPNRVSKSNKQQNALPKIWAVHFNAQKQSDLFRKGCFFTPFFLHSVASHDKILGKILIYLGVDSMIAVLKPNTAKQQMDLLIQWLEKMGLQVRIYPANDVTVLGLIGDLHQLDPEL